MNQGASFFQLRRAVAADVGALVRLIDMSSGGGIAEDYRRRYGPGVDWHPFAEADILRTDSDLSYERATLLTRCGAVAGGVILNHLVRQAIEGFDGTEVARAVGALLAGAEGSLLVRELAVFPPHRRRGGARALLDFSADVGRRHGIRRLSLTVQADNAAALSLYAAAGFLVRESAMIAGGRVLLLTLDL